MSKISLNLSNDTIKTISTIAKKNDATISEVARYLIAKGLANYKNNELAKEAKIIPQEQSIEQMQV